MQRRSWRQRCTHSLDVGAPRASPLHQAAWRARRSRSASTAALLRWLRSPAAKRSGTAPHTQGTTHTHTVHFSFHRGALLTQCTACVAQGQAGWMLRTRAHAPDGVLSAEACLPFVDEGRLQDHTHSALTRTVWGLSLRVHC